MKYIMATQYGSMDEVLFKDIIDHPNTSLCYVSEPMKNKALYKIRRIHTSMAATKYFEPPFKAIWYKKRLFSMIEKNTCIFFQPASMLHIGMSTLKSLRKDKPGVKLVLLLLDSIHAYSNSMKYAKKYIFSFDWDLIISFDENDCKEFGFAYMGLSYYSKLDNITNNKDTNDLFYIGAIKDESSRTRLLLDIYKRCIQNNVQCSFKFLAQKELPELKKQGINILHKPMHYKEVLMDVSESNCILELVQPGQKNQTARYMEAVCYNKKLLTNNPRIKELPYYSPSYMRVFSSPDEIDVSWIKNKEDVNYHYKGDFSPLKILDIVEEAWK